MTQAKAFAADHVAECSRDLLVWWRTGRLPAGKMRELGDILKAGHVEDYLQVAENLIVKAAVLVASKTTP